jgi:outer membrane protein assembly factor BamB
MNAPRLVASVVVAGFALANSAFAHPHPAPAHGWLNWRGPQQNGASAETNLPDKWVIDGENHLWSLDLPGRGTPVIANGKVYAWGYDGEGPDLQQVLACLDAATGKKLWEARFNDFLSDIVYERYAIGAPAIDPDTGNVYVLTAAGIFAAFTADGQKLWERSLMEEFGRLTFPNGRTGAPVIDDDLVIVRGITSNWGVQGPGADRFYAFDKRSGEHVWASTPGAVPPKDSSYSTPVLAWRNGQRVLYAGTGDGSLVCFHARTGEPIWRYGIGAGGVNSSVVLWGDLLIGGHADENLDSSEMGRVVAVNIAAADRAAAAREPTGPRFPGGATAVALDRSVEAWRNTESLLTSSPVVVGDRVYLVNKVGELCALDPQTGRVLWRKKLGADQLHASPVYADGKLYIPMREDGFYIIRPGADGGEVLSHTPLDGEALGAPAVWNGRIYVHTTRKLYCFGRKNGADPHPDSLPQTTRERGSTSGEGAVRSPGPVAQLQVVPSEVLLRAGQSQTFRLRGLDANGQFVKEYKSGQWRKFVPPGALVRAEMDAEFNDRGVLVSQPGAKLSAGSWEVTVKDGDRELKGFMRGRVLPDFPYRENFEGFELTGDSVDAPGQKFAYPPLPWIGGRFRWEIRARDDTQALVKTTDRLLFQRAMTFIGDPAKNNYTIAADVLSEGTRRMMSNVGVINQRYIINLVGNWQQLEVLSNHDRIKVTAPFRWQPNEWYRIKSRVDVAADGSGVVRAKAWKRGEPEPDGWLLEVPHNNAHKQGAPGLYGFALQGLHPVYIDNIEVTANE